MSQRKLDCLDRRLVLTFDRDLHAHVLHLRIVKDFFQIVHGRVRHVVGFEPFDPVRARFFFEKYRESFVELIVIGPPVRPGVEARIIDQLGMLHGFAQPLPKFLR